MDMRVSGLEGARKVVAVPAALPFRVISEPDDYPDLTAGSNAWY